MGLAAVCLAVSFFASDARFAYKVSYRGNVIANVGSRSELAGALKIIEEKVNGNDVAGAIDAPDYSAAIVLKGSIVGVEELSDILIENNENIVPGNEITVDGVHVATVCGDEIQSFLESKLASYDIEGAECTSSFKEEVVFTEGLFLTKDFDNIELVKEKLDGLTVETTATFVTDSEIAFKTVTQQSGSYAKGYSAVTRKGETGTRRKVEIAKYVNGEKVSEEVASDTVIKEAVDKIIVKGNAPTAVSASQQTIAKNSGFLFPLPNGVWRVSAYFGDGRNHKGIDLCAPKGTPIMAVKSGTVVYSGWRGGYGNCVEIDHGNNMHTRYGHASALCVKVGEKVNAGDVIALVGTTGDSTGNHLHFEVIIGGERYNPAPYIGL